MDHGTSGRGPQPSLITAQALAALQGDPALVVVDCRFDLMAPQAGRAAYAAGHIPGARHAHLDYDLAGPRGPATGRHPLPPLARLRRTLAMLGIGEGHHVVVHDAHGGAFAARLWWLLRFLGHRQVSLLDGGLAAWQAAGLPLTEDAPCIAPAPPYGGRPGGMPVVDTPTLEQRLAAGTVTLLDVRAEARYAGEVEPIDPVAGHVPGAINAPFQACIDAQGRFLPAEALNRHFTALLEGRTAPLVVMCGSGITACHGIFALTLGGFPGAALYAGSWSEWITDPARPVARH